MNQKKPLGKRQLFYLWCALACAVVAIDQFTKMLVVDYFKHAGQALELTSFFNLVRAHNTGAAFSFLANAGGWQQWFFVGLAGIVSVIILTMLYKYSNQRLFCLGLSAVLGGAIGNVVDRIHYGYVVDFLDFHLADMHFPAFNVADIGITVGVAIIIVHELLQMRKDRKAAKAP